VCCKLSSTLSSFVVTLSIFFVCCKLTSGKQLSLKIVAATSQVLNEFHAHLSHLTNGISHCLSQWQVK